MAKMSKGVIVEFDFTVLNGAEILFDTARSCSRERAWS